MLLEVILGGFSGALDFLFLMTPIVENQYFWWLGGLKIRAFWTSFSGGGVGRPQERYFLNTDTTNNAKGVPKGAHRTPGSQ